MLASNEIRPRVELILNAYLKGVKTRPEDKPVIDAGVDLLVSVLECLHDISHHLENIECNQRSNGQ